MEFGQNDHFEFSLLFTKKLEVLHFEVRQQTDKWAEEKMYDVGEDVMATLPLYQRHYWLLLQNH